MVARRDYQVVRRSDGALMVTFDGVPMVAQLELLPDGTVRGAWQTLQVPQRRGFVKVRPEPARDPRWFNRELVDGCTRDRQVRVAIHRVLATIYAQVNPKALYEQRPFWRSVRVSILGEPATWERGAVSLSGADLMVLARYPSFRTELLQLDGLGPSYVDNFLALWPVMVERLQG